MDGDIWDSRDLELLQKHVNWRTTFGGKATIKMQITSINLEVNMIGVECVKICPEMGVEGLGGLGVLAQLSGTAVPSLSSFLRCLEGRTVLPRLSQSVGSGQARCFQSP